MLALPLPNRIGERHEWRFWVEQGRIFGPLVSTAKTKTDCISKEGRAEETEDADRSAWRWPPWLAFGVVPLGIAPADHQGRMRLLGVPGLATMLNEADCCLILPTVAVK